MSEMSELNDRIFMLTILIKRQHRHLAHKFNMSEMSERAQLDHESALGVDDETDRLRPGPMSEI